MSEDVDGRTIAAVAERVHRNLATNLDRVDGQYSAFLCQIQKRVTELAEQCMLAARYERQEAEDLGVALEAEARRLELVVGNCHDLVAEFDDLTKLSDELDETKRRLTAVERALDGLP